MDDPVRFAVNCSMLFTELPLLERAVAARAAGFDAVEFWWPFTEAAPGDREIDALRFPRQLGVLVS
jgi:hydroxypyruvate isomerase